MCLGVAKRVTRPSHSISTQLFLLSLPLPPITAAPLFICSSALLSPSENHDVPPGERFCVSICRKLSASLCFLRSLVLSLLPISVFQSA